MALAHCACYASCTKLRETLIDSFSLVPQVWHPLSLSVFSRMGNRQQPQRVHPATMDREGEETTPGPWARRGIMTQPCIAVRRHVLLLLRLPGWKEKAEGAGGG